MNAFGEFIFNRRGDQITGLYHKQAEFCRLSKQDPASLDVKHLLYSPEYATGWPPEKERIKRLPLMPWYDEEGFLAKLGTRKVAYHTKFETPGIMFYARPFWIGLFRENGWADASIAVPEVVTAMMRNQVVLKYQILIPESYFRVRHKEWDTYDDKNRQDIIDALVKKLNAELADTSNAYKSITTVFRLDDMRGTPEGKIEIIAIDDKVKKDSWVPSSEKSDAQIVQGLGLHPSQVGLAPQGGKMGAGSGSDQRETYNIGITVNTLDQEIVLDPLNFVARFNSQI
jgi:hypothetical protein